MEEFISNLISSSSNFIGGRTLAPGPVIVPSRAQGPLLLSDLAAAAGNTGQVPQEASNSEILEARRNTSTTNKHVPTSTSIVRTDMSPMLEWLRSHTTTVNSQSQQSVSASLESQANESYTSEDYRKSIPKPYNQLTKKDCAGIVAESIRSIVLHTCNDEFRQQCLTKLGATNSRDVEREIKSRLLTIMEQDEQQTPSDDIENQEVDHPESTTS